MTTTDRIPCPLACGRQVASAGDEIHYCSTTTRYGSKTVTHREYVGTYDGQAMFYGNSQHDVEVQLRPYVEELEASELVRSATELDGGDPEAVTLVEPELPNGWMRMPEGDILDTNGMRVTVCPACQGAHHVQRCPAIGALLMQPMDLDWSF